MSHRLFRSLPVLLSVSVLLTPGCSKNAPLKAIPQDQMAATLDATFREAKPQVKAKVKDAVDAMKTNGFSPAFVVLQDLCMAPELTDAQRPVVLRCLITLKAQIETNSASQNNATPQQAAEGEILKQYQSVK
jgi:hypothetical protein